MFSELLRQGSDPAARECQLLRIGRDAGRAKLVLPASLSVHRLPVLPRASESLVVSGSFVRLSLAGVHLVEPLAVRSAR